MFWNISGKNCLILKISRFKLWKSLFIYSLYFDIFRDHDIATLTKLNKTIPNTDATNFTQPIDFKEDVNEMETTPTSANLYDYYFDDTLQDSFDDPFDGYNSYSDDYYRIF